MIIDVVMVNPSFRDEKKLKKNREVCCSLFCFCCCFFFISLGSLILLIWISDDTSGFQGSELGGGLSTLWYRDM